MKWEITSEVQKDEEMDFQHSADLLASTTFIHGESLIVCASHHTYRSAIEKGRLSLGGEVADLYVIMIIYDYYDYDYV